MYKVGDIIITKKAHVCGSNEWKITRTGIDVKLVCMGCQREIMMNSNELIKKIKQIKEA